MRTGRWPIVSVPSLARPAAAARVWAAARAAWADRPEGRILGQVRTAYGVAERGLGRGAAVLDGESVGVCGMFTEPHARGRGTAGRLLADLLGWAHDRGARRAYLCVVADNVSALRSYERSGFVGVSEYHNRVLP